MSTILSVSGILKTGAEISQYFAHGIPPGTSFDAKTGILSGAPIGDTSGVMHFTALPVSGTPIKLSVNYTVANGVINTVYRQGISGSISGFDTITFSDDATLSESNNSLTTLVEKLKELISLYGPENLRSIEKTVLNHVRDFNNPHRDTIEDITGGDIAEVFDLVLPGTPPARPPVASYKAGLEMASPASSLTVSRNSEIIIIDEQGFLRYYSENSVGTDWSTGEPVIPCWPQVNQLITMIDPTQNSNFTTTNTSMVNAYHTGVIPKMLSTQITLFEGGVQGEQSLSFTEANLLAAATDYTFSIFVYPSGYTENTLYIDIGESNHIFFSLSDPTSYLATSGVAVYVHTLPNGWYRIGVTFTSADTTASVKIGYDPHTYTDITTAVAGIAAGNRAYIGTAGKAMFSLFGPQITDVPGMAPFIQSGSLAPTVLTYPGFDNAISIATGMVSVGYTIYKTLTGNVATTIMTIPKVIEMVTDKTNSIKTIVYLLISSEESTVTVTITSQSDANTTYSAQNLPDGLILDSTTGVISGTLTTAQSGNMVITATTSTGTDTITIPYLVQASTDADGLILTTSHDDGLPNNFALSFSPSKISYMSSTDNRIDVVASAATPFTPTDSMTSVSFGPFFGGISMYNQYAVADDNDALSFLVGQ